MIKLQTLTQSYPNKGWVDGDIIYLNVDHIFSVRDGSNGVVNIVVDTGEIVVHTVRGNAGDIAIQIHTARVMRIGQ